MGWTQRDIDWVAARLLPDIYDINQRIRYDRTTQQLRNLERELMKFRITEPTFFFQKDRHVGEIMEAPVGPYRNELVGGQGLKRVPQFVELPHEIHVTDSSTEVPAPVPTATVLPPVTMAAISDKVVSSVTGAGHAALSIKQMMADGKNAIAAAHQHVLDQAGKLNKAADALHGLGDDLGSEADDLLAAIGQFKNFLGE